MLGAEFIKAQLALRNKPSGPPVAVAATKSAEAEEARQNVHSAPYASSLLRCDRTVDDACIRAARVWRRRAPCRAHLQHRAGQRACLNGDPPQRHSIVAKPPNGMVRRRLATVRGSAKPIVSLEFFPPKTRAGVEVRARPANADAACTLNRACERSFRARKGSASFLQNLYARIERLAHLVDPSFVAIMWNATNPELTIEIACTVQQVCTVSNRSLLAAPHERAPANERTHRASLPQHALFCRDYSIALATARVVSWSCSLCAAAWLLRISTRRWRCASPTQTTRRAR